ncbi:acetate/propionate family kinase, partial [Buchnera aphidicola (Hormaphis cornu)]
MLNSLILVLNCGSSSVKFAILNPLNGKKYLYGQSFSSCSSKSQIKWNINNISYHKIFENQVLFSDIICYIINDIVLKQSESFVKAIKGIGHRVVHGGYKLQESMLINHKVIECIKEVNCFAPIHNPINLLGIKLAMNLFPVLSKNNVAVFDTSFYHTLPEHAYLYAIPYDFYTKHKIRRYGAHGISHSYITNKSSTILKKSKKLLNIISCHLGNGCSIAAICNGVCVDISMGLTPLEGLVMGTRSGDIDPAI